MRGWGELGIFLQADGFWDLLQTPEGSITVVGLLLFIVVAFFRGWLISGPAHAERMKEKDARIAGLIVERDEYKKIVFDGFAFAEAAVTKLEQDKREQVGRHRRRGI